MKLKALVPTLLLTALALVAAAGCGGGGGKSRNKAYASSKADFAAAMNSICGPVEQQLKQLNVTTEAEIITKGPKAVDIERKALDRIESLQPPDEIKDAVKDFVSQGREGTSKIEDLIDAVKNKDAAKMRQLEGDLSAIDRKTDVDARAIGATGCISQS